LGHRRAAAAGVEGGIVRPFGLLFVLVFLSAAPPALAAQDDGRLDDLFERLRITADAGEASNLEARIWRIWLRSSKAKVNALMAGGVRRMDGGELAKARDTFAKITRLAPKFAEGWNKLATVNYLLRDYNASALDIARTLSLEPRHFGALSGLGLVNMALDRPGRALKSFREALKIHPHMQGVRSNILRL
jgi:tetratricopeptide (TPR) repeat protein